MYKQHIIVKFIYFLLMGFIVYNVCFKSTLEKENDLKVIKACLSVSLDNDTELIRFTYNSRRGAFVVNSLMSKKNQNLNNVLKELKALGWTEIDNINKDQEEIYYFSKDSVKYNIHNYKANDNWGEYISAK